jgi:hypothetical protein
VQRRITERVTENVNVTENRAPTDESVRLLKEMQEKAEKALLATTYVETNGLKATVQTFRQAWDDSVKAVAQVDLNGKSIRVEHVAPRRDAPHERIRLMAEVRDKIATAIANEVMQDFRFDF